MIQPLDTRLLKMVRKHFNSPLVSRETNRRYQRAWCRSVRQLGSRWLMAKPLNSTS